jgi:hypothetical protein
MGAKNASSTHGYHVGMSERNAVSEPRVSRGVCHAVFAYDVGHAIDLEAAERGLVTAAERQTVKQKRRAPAYFEYQPAPLRITRDAAPVEITPGGVSTAPGCELRMYDFGAVSVAYAVPLAGPLEDLARLSYDLYGNAVLVADSRRQLERLLAELGAAVVRPQIAQFVEDYAIFQIEELVPGGEPAALWSTQAETVARILRAEVRTLSEQETTGAIGARLSFGAADATFIAADAALIFDAEPEDIRAVIEFANTQLLEMRYLDQQLDAALERAYRLLLPARGRSGGAGRRAQPALAELAQLQLESAILFEQVTNALKLVGEQFLARVYRLASQHFRLSEWDAAITRKLATLESIYAKTADRAAARRMETLEWIIIALIAISIILGLT